MTPPMAVYSLLISRGVGIARKQMTVTATVQPALAEKSAAHVPRVARRGGKNCAFLTGSVICRLRRALLAACDVARINYSQCGVFVLASIVFIVEAFELGGYILESCTICV